MKNTARKKIFVLVALLLTVLMMGVHLYLNKHHVDLKLGVGSSNSVCNVSEKFNCDIAATSSYAEIFGIPMALLGAFTAAFLLILLLIVHFQWSENQDRVERYALYLASFVAGVSLVMGGISFFVLHGACPFCIVTYVLSFLIWLLLWMAFRPEWSHFGEDLRDVFTTEKWILWTALSVPVLSFIVNNMILDSYGYQEIKKTAESSLSSWQSAPAQNFDLSLGLTYQKGTGEAKITVVEFADFLCSHCKHASEPLHQFAENHPDVKLVFKNFPLDGVCNPAVTHRGDGKRCELSYAVMCAEKLQQKGWQAHKYIFDRQEQIFSMPMDQVLTGVCEDTGANCEQMKTCMASEEIHSAVRKMATEGDAAKISGTPSVFVNGKNLPGGQLLPVLEYTYKNLPK